MLAELKGRLLEISDLRMAGAVLGWDQATYMPEGGADARGRQGAALYRLAHERAVAPAIGKLLDALSPFGESLPYDADDASLIRVARRDFDKAIKVPADYVARSNAHGSASYDAWTRARPANDFAAMVPYLEKTLDLSREYSDFFAPYKHVADPHIDDADEGMTTASIRKLFGELRRELVPMVRAICDQPPADDSCLHQTFPKAGAVRFRPERRHSAWATTSSAAGSISTHHPFCTKFSDGDVRITTRVNENDLGDALFSTLHEAGHAMYEQGVRAALGGKPLGEGVSAGVHESQSRLWENVVARSRGFWEHFYPLLQRAFPDQFARVPLDGVPSRHQQGFALAHPHRRRRGDLQSPRHAALRSRTETARGQAAREGFAGGLARRDAGRASASRRPTIATAACRTCTGSAAASAADFRATPSAISWPRSSTPPRSRRIRIFRDEIAHGEFGTLHTWLRDNIYQHGSKFTPNELVKRATGSAMSMQPYLDYLRGKYGELYRLPAGGS